MENVIEIKGLRKSFGSSEILKNVTLSVEKGENRVILGKSGEGKSVTIKCVAGLMEQDEGSIKVLGKEVRDLDEEELRALRARIGFLFQSAALYDSMTVAENLAFPLTRVLGVRNAEEIHDRSLEVLESVGLPEAMDKMPADLSGGMRKRVGLARTLIVKPEIILYDEPTTGLDPITSREISELIMQIQRKYKASSIVITHDLSCARITADRVSILNEGETVTEGTYEELEKSDDPFIQSFFKQ
jgi:phospholipid/cholesterol/gamma-HCH transport system ATP-binding protein